MGLTRGRLENLACVVVEDHARRRGTPATPVEVLAAALARSGVEPAATQVVRDQLARSEDLAVLYPMLEQARAAVDDLAGPDRSADVAVLCRQAAPSEAVEAQLRAAAAWLAGVEAELATVTARVDELSPGVRAGHEGRWWRRSRREVVGAASAELDQVLVRRHELAGLRNQAVMRVGSLETDLGTARRAATGLAEMEAQQAGREAILARQPAEVVWERELRRRIAERTKELGSHALHDPSEHLLRLLGPPGALMTEETWAGVAGRIEGYRERWRVRPDELGSSWPRDTAQAKHWRAVELLLPEPTHAEPTLSVAGRDPIRRLGR